MIYDFALSYRVGRLGGVLFCPYSFYRIELPLTDQPYMTVQTHVPQSRFMSELEKYYKESLEE